MKREAVNSTKMKKLCRLLDLPLYAASGILELIWHLTARETPQGNIGKLSDEDIALAIDWRGDQDVLIDALVRCGWLDRDEQHRLIIHDWHEHADEAVKKKLSRSGRPFILSRRVETESGRVETKSDDGSLPGPEPLPLPEPAPAPGASRAANGSESSEVSNRAREHPPGPAVGSFHDQSEYIATAVINEIGVTTPWARNQIVQQAEHELRSTADTDKPLTMDEIRDGMIHQWKQYRELVQQSKVRGNAMKAETFFGEGIWKNSTEWNLKRGVTINGTSLRPN